MKKVLIIGQAPPAVTQTVPYDTTLLYEMLSWAGVSKERAQEIFEFEAMTDKFPGHGDNGHLAPSEEEMKKHYYGVLINKIVHADKILVLGAVAKKFLNDKCAFDFSPDKDVVFMIHPSKRNYDYIMKNKEKIADQLIELLKLQ